MERNGGGGSRGHALYVLLGHEKTLVYTLNDMEKHGRGWAWECEMV